MKHNKQFFLFVATIIITALLIPAGHNAVNYDIDNTDVVEQIIKIIPPTPKEFLKQEIEKQGLNDRDFIILSEIVRCESGWEQCWADGTVKVSKGNIGLAQINWWSHHKEYEQLGLDPNDAFQNLTFAVILYKRNGIRDWKQWSGHCFLPALAKKGITFN